MSRIQRLDANSQTQAIFQEIEEAFGMVPNLFRATPTTHRCWKPTGTKSSG